MRRTNDIALGIVWFAVACFVCALSCALATHGGWWIKEGPGSIRVAYGTLGACFYVGIDGNATTDDGHGRRDDDDDPDERRTVCYDYSDPDGATDPPVPIPVDHVAVGIASAVAYFVALPCLLCVAALGGVSFCRVGPVRAPVWAAATFTALCWLLLLPALAMPLRLLPATGAGGRPGRAMMLALAAPPLALCGLLFAVLTGCDRRRGDDDDDGDGENECGRAVGSEDPETVGLLSVGGRALAYTDAEADEHPPAARTPRALLSALRARVLRALDSSRDEENSKEESDDHAVGPLDLLPIAAVGAAALCSLFDVWRLFLPFDAIAVVAVALGGWPIYREALEDGVLRLRMTMEVSMTLALGAALAMREFTTAVLIVFFVLIAELLEHLTVGQGRKAIRALTDLLPRTATVLGRAGNDNDAEDGSDCGGVGSGDVADDDADHDRCTAREIPVGDLRAGQVVLVRPGDRIPVDGCVVRGHSFVEQATITGEPAAAEKVAGSSVFAGTLNGHGCLEVRVSGVGADSAFGRIVEAVERAERSRAPIQRTADRLAGYLVYFALLCAFVTFALTFDAEATISVVIVAGACGVAAGTPLAVLGAIGLAARQGAIVKGGMHLEQLADVGTVCLDKTGTLTLGEPRVTDVVSYDVAIATETELLALAAAAELPSEHPVAKAIVRAAAARCLSSSRAEIPEDWSYTPGRGVACTVRGASVLVGNAAWLRDNGVDRSPPSPRDRATAVGAESGGGTGAHQEALVARDGRLLGCIRVADVLRDGARKAVGSLRAMGLRVVLLTGDGRGVAQEVARRLAVSEVLAEQLPQDKLVAVRGFVRRGESVAMVGDGVNDAPALAEATVGIAMGSGADVARDCASVVLLGDDLSRLVAVIATARRCRRIVWFNFAGTIAVDLLGMALAAFGYINPLIAALIHTGSELFFIGNSARLVLAGRANRCTSACC